MPDEPATKVPERLRNPHPLIAESLRHFDRRRTNYEGILYGHVNDRHLHLSVSPATFPRATRIADTLLKLLESAGHAIALPPDRKGGFVATLDGQSLRVHLREQLQQVKVQETYGERTILRPTGRLELLIDEYLDGTRKRWADGKKRGTIENQLERVHEGLRIATAAKRRHEEELAEQRHHWEAEERRRQEQAARRLEENQRAEKLENQVARWERSRRIRDYLAAVREWARRDNRLADLKDR